MHLVCFYITLPTLMMHGQTQIKFKRYCVGDMKTRQMKDKIVWPHERKKWGNTFEKCVRLVTIRRRFGIWKWRGRACCGK